MYTSCDSRPTFTPVGFVHLVNTRGDLCITFKYGVIRASYYEDARTTGQLILHWHTICEGCFPVTANFYLKRQIASLHTSLWSTAAKTAQDDVQALGQRLHSGSINSCQRCANVGPATCCCSSIVKGRWQNTVIYARPGKETVVQVRKSDWLLKLAFDHQSWVIHYDCLTGEKKKNNHWGSADGVVVCVFVPESNHCSLMSD